MAKITNYDPGSFSPAAVGVPGRDRSGDILASGINDLGKVLMQREDNANSISAMSRFGDFQYEYISGKEKLQGDFRDKPKEYPKAVKAFSDKLISDLTKTMTPGVVRKFTALVTSHVAQDMDNLVGWAVNRENEVIIGDIHNSYQNGALAAEKARTPQQLKDALIMIDAVSKLSQTFVAPATDIAWKERYKNDAVQNAIDARIVDDPVGLYNDLASGRYDDILTTTQIKRALPVTKTAIINNAILDQYKNITSAAVEISQLHEALNDGEITVSEITRRLEVAELNKNTMDVNGQPIISDNYIRGLSALRDIALNQRKFSSEDEQAFSADFERRWDMFLANRPKHKTASPADYDEAIGLYADLIEARRDGLIREDTFQKKKKILDTRLTSALNPAGKGAKYRSASLSEALANAGKYGWFNNPRDIYSTGYTIIRDYINKYRRDLSETDKIRFRDDFMVSYTAAVNRFSPEQIDGITNMRRFATDVLYGGNGQIGVIPQIDMFVHPDGDRLIVYGQTILYNGRRCKFLGIDPETGEILIDDPTVEKLLK